MPDEQLVTRFKAAACVASLIAAIVAALGLLYWGYGPIWLSPKLWNAMAPVAACTLILLSAATALLREPAVTWRRRSGLGLAALAACIGALASLNFVITGRAGSELEIRLVEAFHQWLGSTPPIGGGPHVSPFAALSFALLGLALLLLDTRVRREHSIGQWLALVPLCIATIALVGHALDMNVLFPRSAWSSLAIPTAVAVVLLSLGTLFTRPHAEPLAFFAAATLGGYIGRRLIPATVLFPLLTAWLWGRGRDLEWFSAEVGLSLLVLANCVFFALLIYSVARALTRLDLRRRQHADQLARSEARFALISRATSDALWDWNLARDQLWWSDGLEETFGFRPSEVPPTIEWWRGRIHPDDRERVFRDIHHTIDSGGTEWLAEYRFSRADGTYAEVADRGFVERDKAGVPVRMVGGVTDISTRKHLEAQRRENEALLEAVLEAMPVAVFIAAQDGGILRANRRAHELWGEPLPVPDSVNDYRNYKGWNVETGEPMQPGEWAMAIALRERRLVRGQQVEIERFGDGTRRTVLQFAAPIITAEGLLRGGVLASVDVTEQRRTEQALRLAKDAAERSRSEMQAILRSMTEGVAVFDAAGNVLEMNPAALSIHGLTSLDELRRHVGELGEIFELRDLSGRVLEPHEWPIARALRGEAFLDYHVAVTRIGTPHTIIGSYGGAPVRDSQGNIVLAVATLRDITRQQQMEEQLAVARSQLERHAQHLEELVQERTARLSESVNELERFSYSLSHDMRAPLRAMRVFSEILQNDYAAQLDSAGRLYLSRIATAAGRLDQLIQDVLSYSRISRERITLGPVSLETLFEQLRHENMSFVAPAAELLIDPPLPTVLGHEAYLTQVFGNLLQNAVKFVTPGQRPHVHLWAETTGERARIFVRDNGVGIPAEAQSRIFGMFERLAPSYEGTGIGLTIVRKALERMGGSIDFESAPGSGSTFWVDLQLAPREAGPV